MMPFSTDAGTVWPSCVVTCVKESASRRSARYKERPVWVLASVRRREELLTCYTMSVRLVEVEHFGHPLIVWKCGIKEQERM